MAAVIRLPSPPSSHNGDLISQNLQQLLEPSPRAQQVNMSSYELNPRDQFRSDYSLQQGECDTYADDSSFTHRSEISPTQYGSYPSKYSVLENEYSTMQNGRSTRYDTPEDSPQSMYPHIDEDLTTRNTTPLSQPEPHVVARVMKAPRMRKGRKDKVRSDKTPRLDKPLSELTKDWNHIPLVDIETYVSRSIEERLREVEESKSGKVKRPMNSFMLYRKAYQNRTKEYSLKNNHQIVSQLCGESWPLEPEGVREQFNKWATIERANHQAAHPGYKFSPSKPGALNKNNKRQTSEETSDDSDLDDFDWERGQTRRVRKQRRGTPWSITSSPHQSRQSDSFSREATPLYAQDYNKSAYHLRNPPRLLPDHYAHGDLQNGRYYQQAVYRNSNTSGVEDVYVRKTLVPGSGQYLSNYPTTEHGVLQPLHTWDHVVVPEQRIDPSLVPHGTPQLYLDSFGSQVAGTLAGGFHDSHEWPIDEFNIKPAHAPLILSTSQDSLQASEQDLHMLKGSQEGWQIEYMEGGSEFEKWMTGH